MNSLHQLKNSPIRKYLFLLALSFSINSFAQFNKPINILDSANYVITYSLKYQRDSLNPDLVIQTDILLLLGQNISKSVSKDFFIWDTIMRNIKSWSEFDAVVSVPNSRVPKVAFRFQIFKNQPKGKLSCIDFTVDGAFKYEENLNLFNWRISQDTMTLKGFKVQKALGEFGGRKWIAWFCPDIPYQDGPYKFNGLPGLIMKVYDSREHYLFEISSLEKLNKNMMIDYVERNHLEVTKQEFFRAEDAFREEVILRAKTAGFNDALQQRIARNLRERNNPIELKRK